MCKVIAARASFQKSTGDPEVMSMSGSSILDPNTKPKTITTFSEQNQTSFYSNSDGMLDTDNKEKAGLVVTCVEALTSAAQAGKEKKRRLKGWRFGVAYAAFMSIAVFSINFVLILSAVTLFEYQNGIAIAYRGSCNKVNRLTTGLHIIINILSSLLLSASNYTMQCLCAPTREELDVAHAKGDWLDIGVPSFRNICGRISWKRTLMWWLLGFSSVPIHLFYNSVFFKTIESNQYDVVVANEEFLTGRPVTVQQCGWTGNYPSTDGPLASLRKFQAFFANNIGSPNTSVIQKLSNEECIKAYASTTLPNRSDVLLVTSRHESNRTVFEYLPMQGGFTPTSNDWIFSSNSYQYDIKHAEKHANNWVVSSYRINYCLSKITPSRCKLQMAVHILAAVAIFNALKSGIMLWTLLRQRATTLVTIGDTIANFLDYPDGLTQRRCLLAGLTRTSNSKSTEAPTPIECNDTVRVRWSASASLRRREVVLILPSVLIFISAFMLIYGIDYLRPNLIGISPFSIGLGKADASTEIMTLLPENGTGGLVCSILLANCPQALCSICYFGYNGLLTSMLQCSEWSRYYLRAKSLRVTTPRGQQRSTYYLHLPYLYGIPLLAACTTLHWLISESIYLVRVDTVYQSFFLNEASTVSIDGYSPLAILCGIVLATSMLLVVLGMGFRRFSSPMPVVRSCSFAIAAACHRPADDLDAAILPVSWGEIEETRTKEVGHCCFTSKEVHGLIPGRKYA